MVTQADVARLAELELSTVNKILNQRSLHLFRDATVKKVFDCARKAGYNIDGRKRYYRRRYPRPQVSLKADLSVYDEDGALHDQGTCAIRELSPSGALISDVSLGRASFPLGKAKLKLRIQTAPLKGVELNSKIVRHKTEGFSGYGLVFRKLSDAAKRKLKRFLH